MDFRLKIAGLAVAAVVFGAFLGKSIDTTPRYFGKDALTSHARQEAGMADSGIYDFDDELPDHYPMITPRGRVEVYELSLYMRRGRLDYPFWPDDDFLPPPPDLDLGYEFAGEDLAARELADAQSHTDPGAVFADGGLHRSGNQAVLPAVEIFDGGQAAGSGHGVQGHYAARLENEQAGRSGNPDIAVRLRGNAR